MAEKRDVTDMMWSEWAPFSVDYGYYCPLMSGSIDGTDSRPHDRGVTRAMGAKCMSISIVMSSMSSLGEPISCFCML